jgi:hypothetical protein
MAVFQLKYWSHGFTDIENRTWNIVVRKIMIRDDSSKFPKHFIIFGGCFGIQYSYSFDVLILSNNVLIFFSKVVILNL